MRAAIAPPSNDDLRPTASARRRRRRGCGARTAAVAPISIADIVDASHQVSAGVVAAWLNDVRQEFAVDAKRLVELANAKVPDRVIDMLVALAYPDAFSVPPSPTAVGALATNQGGGAQSGFGTLDAFDNLDCASDFSLFGFGGCSPFAYSPFGYSPFGYMPYGYLPYASSRFGFGAFGAFAGAYGGWYDTAPIVVVGRWAVRAWPGRQRPRIWAATQARRRRPQREEAIHREAAARREFRRRHREHGELGRRRRRRSNHAPTLGSADGLRSVDHELQQIAVRVSRVDAR